MGADNPDNLYLSAAIDGRYDYRLSGHRGSVHYLGFGSYAGGYGESGRRGQTGYLDARELAVGPNEPLEIVLSCQRPPDGVAWLPLEPDSSLLIVRQTFLDRSRERPAELHIERIGATGGPPPLAPEALERGLRAAAAFIHGTASLFADWAEGFAQRPNQLPRFDETVAAAAHGDPNIVYYHGYWELGEDEALVVEVRPPACEYWNFQLNNHWMESLDYRYHRIALNHHEALAEPDGRVRLVVAASDPGLPNWLETAGHRRGTMCLRWIGATEHPDPETRVVPLATLQAEAHSRATSGAPNGAGTEPRDG